MSADRTEETHKLRRRMSACWDMNGHSAEIHRPPLDPFRKSNQPFCCDAQQPLFDVINCRFRARGSMRRRDFISLIGSAASWPLGARAQQSALPVVGLLNSGTFATNAKNVEAMRQGLKESGFIDGQNVAIEFRWAENQFDRLPALATDLVRKPAAVIVGNTPAALSAKAVTATIPIVFTTGSDPVRDGLVASLNRPGGNVTGIVFITERLGAKRLELLR